MQFIPIKTKIFMPPKDDITPGILSAAKYMQDGDLLLVTSKIVAIGEGRCIKVGFKGKDALILEECDLFIPRDQVPGRYATLTILHNTLIPSSGIDESNGNGYYILWPEDPFRAAKNIWELIREKTNLTAFGIILTDSRSVPLRYGVVGTSIAFWGFNPLHDLIGTTDIFNRRISVSKQNIPDAIAGAGVYLMGETVEQTPLMIVRDVPNITFTDRDMRQKLMVPPEDDIFAPLYSAFTKSKKVAKK